jgi:predicted GNAT family acetyltransferase
MNLKFTPSKTQLSIGQTFDVFDEDNIMVGIFQFHKLLEDKNIIEIDRLYIKKKYQRKGIGTYIVKSIFAKYKPEKIIACCLSVGFWLSMGFLYMPDKWGWGYYECLRSNFLKKKKEIQKQLQKQKNKNHRVKPTAKKLMTMQYFGDMDESKLIDIVGNKLSVNQYNKLNGINTEEKVKNLKKYWYVKE